MISFATLAPSRHVDLGYLPMFLDAADPRPAREQIDANYQHGGGWRPLDGWTMDPATKRISYPGDPSLRPLAIAKLRAETLLFYDYAWLAIVQPDGSFEIARLD